MTMNENSLEEDFLAKIVEDLSDEQRQKLQTMLLGVGGGQPEEPQQPKPQQPQTREIDELTESLLRNFDDKTLRRRAADELTKAICSSSPPQIVEDENHEIDERIDELTGQLNELASAHSFGYQGIVRRQKISDELAALVQQKQRKAQRTAPLPVVMPDNCSRHVGTFPASVGSKGGK